jgi:hypothetical protein
MRLERSTVCKFLHRGLQTSATFRTGRTTAVVVEHNAGRRLLYNLGG